MSSFTMRRSASSGYQPAHAATPAGAVRRRRRPLALLGGASLAAATLAVVAGTGGFSLFSGSVAPASSQPVSSGTVTINFGSASGTGDELTVGATNVAPGDTIQRGVTLTNSGSVNLSQVTFQLALPNTSTDTNPLTEATSTASGGATTTANELQLQVQACSVAWTATALTDGGYSYTCSASGGATSVLASTPVSTLMSDTTTPPVSGSTAISGVPLPGLNSLTAGGTDYLVATLTLPSTVPNSVYVGTTSTSMQGLSTAFNYTFVATQAAGSPQ